MQYICRMGLIYYPFLISIVILLLPLFCVLSLISLFVSGPPLLFLQKRVGVNGQPFLLYKFRTMTVGAEKLQSKYQHLNEANGPVFKIHADPRFTTFGKFLSHTGLDELPQLINVLRGNMSLFGPRPLPLNEAAKLNSWQKVRSSIKPGIISPWIIEGYHKNTFDTWMKSDLTYIQKKSLWYDISLLSKAVVFVVGLFISEVRRVYSSND